MPLNDIAVEMNKSILTLIIIVFTDVPNRLPLKLVLAKRVSQSNVLCSTTFN